MYGGRIKVPWSSDRLREYVGTDMKYFGLMVKLREYLGAYLKYLGLIMYGTKRISENRSEVFLSNDVLRQFLGADLKCLGLVIG